MTAADCVSSGQHSALLRGGVYHEHVLELADLEAGYGREEWNGWGYLGERRNVLAAINHEPGFGDWSVGERGREDIAAADAAILARANELGWDADDLFEWANSRNGRHFADRAFEGPEGLATAMSWSVAPGGAGLGSPFGTWGHRNDLGR